MSLIVVNDLSVFLGAELCQFYIVLMQLSKTLLHLLIRFTVRFDHPYHQCSVHHPFSFQSQQPREPLHLSLIPLPHPHPLAEVTPNKF